jgi:type IV pilus assembly protein PilN
MIRINLLAERRATAGKGGPKLPKMEMGASAENLLYISIVVLAVLFCGYKWWSLNNELAEVNAQVEQAQVEVEEVREGLRIIAELEAKKELVEQQVEIISGLKRARTIPVDLMNHVNTNLPDFLWFRSMTEKGQQLSFSGRATTSTAPANLYNNLTDSPFFDNVVLNEIAKDRDGVRFSLSCKFVPGGKQAVESDETDEG